jgi:hypothetical protein
MHLVIANNSVAFLTLPILQPQLNNNGIFTVSHTFSEAGEYKMWANAKPKGGAQCLAAFRLSVTGEPFHATAGLVPDRRFTRNQLMRTIRFV